MLEQFGGSEEVGVSGSRGHFGSPLLYPLAIVASYCGEQLLGCQTVTSYHQYSWDIFYFALVRASLVRELLLF